MALSALLSKIGQGWRIRAENPELLASSLRLDPTSHTSIQADLQALGRQDDDYSQVITSQTSIPASERIVPFLSGLLGFVARHASMGELTRRANARAPSASVQQYKAAYDMWAEVYSRASLCFATTQDMPYFGPSLRYVGTSLVLLAIAADEVSRSPQHPCVTDAVSKLSRTTGIAAVDRSAVPGEKTKRAEVLWLANASFRCYFKLKNIRLCETVLGSVENALSLNRNFASPQTKASFKDEELGLACYKRCDRVAYKYYLGRLRLSQHRIRKAYGELRWAFDNCTNVNMHNKRLILIYLTVAALILGIYPSQALLASASLDAPFQNLVERLRLGDGAGMLAHLDAWREWFRGRGCYLLLREKLQVGAWRNLMRRSFLIARLQDPPPVTAPGAKTPPPTFKLTSFLAAARLAWQDDTLTLDDVECVAVSLVDQGYVKGYILHGSSRVVLRRTEDFGFVTMSQVYQ